MAMLTTGQCATLACLLEVTAPKPGNVHRAADFADTTLNDFVASAVAIAPAMDQAMHRSVGQTVLDAITATARASHANTNLGIVLLLAPLAAVPRQRTLSESLSEVLASLTPDDAKHVYQAVRLANPGGLQPVDEKVLAHDIQSTPPDDLLTAMRAAAHRDGIAKQYASDFRDVFEVVVPSLLDQPQLPLPDRIVHSHVQLMSRFPDSLIARKGGQSLAAESAARAAAVLEAGDVGSEGYHRALSDLDFWLRSDGQRRNPGTTADLIAAGLFVLLRERKIEAPFG